MRVTESAQMSPRASEGHRKRTKVAGGARKSTRAYERHRKRGRVIARPRDVEANRERVFDFSPVLRDVLVGPRALLVWMGP